MEVAPLLPHGGPVEEGEEVALVFLEHFGVVLLRLFEAGGGLVGKAAVDVGLEEGGVLGECGGEEVDGLGVLLAAVLLPSIVIRSHFNLLISIVYH